MKVYCPDCKKFVDAEIILEDYECFYQCPVCKVKSNVSRNQLHKILKNINRKEKVC